MKLRNLSKMTGANDGTRTLTESIMAPEVIKAIDDLRNKIGNGVLIGGVAYSYYCKPRYTQDIDVLFSDENNIPDTINSFKRNRGHAFIHLNTHVEVEVLTPEHVGMDSNTVNTIIRTAIEVDGIKIASRSGLVASKLGRASYQDKHDIINLIQSGDIDISDFHLSDEQIDLFNQLKSEAVSYK